MAAANNRLFVEAVLYRYLSGSAWRDLPERSGDWKNTYRRFSLWAASGVRERIFHDLAADAGNEQAMTGSTIVRAHQHSAGTQKESGKTKAIGRSRGALLRPFFPPGDCLAQNVIAVRRPSSNESRMRRPGISGLGMPPPGWTIHWMSGWIVIHPVAWY